MDLKKLAVELFLKSVESVKPSNLIPQNLSLYKYSLKIKGKSFTIPEKLHVFGSGKAAIEMAKSVKNILNNRVAGGLIVSNYYENLGNLEVCMGSHPVPDKRSILAAERLIERMSSLSSRDFFIYLLSGGSSALIEKPIPPISLEDIKITNQILLENSVPIDEINIIRKHISLIKGGRLGRITQGKGIVLVISDVIGDDLFTIGSAPLYYDTSTYNDALNVIEKYNLKDKVPKNVLKVLNDGKNGLIPETPKEENPKIKHFLIGNNSKALESAKAEMDNLISTYIMTSQLKGEAREVAKSIIAIGKEIEKNSRPFKPPVCLLFGGETTVEVLGNGKGGRNQEMVLSALIELKNTQNIVFLSCGTDGIDGNSNYAGAVIDSNDFKRLKETNLNPFKFLKNNDSNTFFKEFDGLIKTGYTGTNVMDISILIVGGNK